MMKPLKLTFEPRKILPGTFPIVIRMAFKLFRDGLGGDGEADRGLLLLKFEVGERFLEDLLYGDRILIN